MEDPYRQAHAPHGHNEICVVCRMQFGTEFCGLGTPITLGAWNATENGNREFIFTRHVRPLTLAIKDKEWKPSKVFPELKLKHKAYEIHHNGKGELMLIGPKAESVEIHHKRLVEAHRGDPQPCEECLLTDREITVIQNIGNEVTRLGNIVKAFEEMEERIETLESKAKELEEQVSLTLTSQQESVSKLAQIEKGERERERAKKTLPPKDVTEALKKINALETRMQVLTAQINARRSPVPSRGRKISLLGPPDIPRPGGPFPIYLEIPKW